MFRDESSHVIKKAKAKARRRDTDGLGDPADQTSPPPAAASDPGTTSAEPTHARHMTLLARRPHHQAAPSKPRPVWPSRDAAALLPQPGAAPWARPPVMAVLYALNPSYLERGTAFFFSRFVAIDEKACHQRFDFIYDIWKPRSLSDAHHHQVDSVMASMTAVGLAGLANMTRSCEVMDSARKSYGTALRLINAALRVPDEAVKDTTMLSILILGLFEMIADPDARTVRGTVKAWHEHVSGAAALAKLRGVAQFSTRAGVKMFMMLCQTVILSCIQQGVPMPQSVLDLRAELSRQLRSHNAPESRIEVSMPIYRVLQFRHEVHSGTLQTPEAVIDRLIEMDDEFERVIANLPSSYSYRLVRLSHPHKDVFDITCHVYPNMAKAAIWNGFRSCRLLILETILTEIHQRFRHVDQTEVPARYAMAFAAARARLPKLCSAIVASVPQHLGLLAAPRHHAMPAPIATVEVCAPASAPQPHECIAALPRPGIAAVSQCQDPSTTSTGRVLDDGGPTLLDPTRARDADEETHRLMLLASAGNTIVWPLYHVGMSSVCSPAMKAYCVDRLLGIYRESGLRQAKAIASIMQNRDVRPSWMEFPLARSAELSQEEVV